MIDFRERSAGTQGRTAATEDRRALAHSLRPHRDRIAVAVSTAVLFDHDTVTLPLVAAAEVVFVLDSAMAELRGDDAR